MLHPFRCKSIRKFHKWKDKGRFIIIFFFPIARKEHYVQVEKAPSPFGEEPFYLDETINKFLKVLTVF